MKIVYLSSSVIPSRSANSIQTMRMCQAFKRQVDEVELVARRGRLTLRNQDIWQYYGIQDQFKLSTVLHFSLPSRSEIFSNILYGLKAAIVAISCQADIHYTRNIWGAYFLTRLGKETLFEVHAWSEDSVSYRVLANVLKGSKVPVIATISRSLAKMLMAAGVSSEKIIVAPDGVDVEFFDRSMKPRHEARQELGLPIDKQIIVYTGDLTELKGVDILLECARRVADNIIFLFVGGRGKADVAKYHSRVRKMGIDNVILTGFVSPLEVPLYLSAADILVMPHKAVTNTIYMSPLKMFEYMAARRPIVASDLPVVRDILVDDSNAVLVKPDSAEALVDGISKLLKYPSLAYRLTQQAYQNVHQYSWDNRVKSILRKLR